MIDKKTFQKASKLILAKYKRNWEWRFTNPTGGKTYKLQVWLEPDRNSTKNNLTVIATQEGTQWTAFIFFDEKHTPQSPLLDTRDAAVEEALRLCKAAINTIE